MRRLANLLAAGILAACASTTGVHEGRQLILEGRLDEGLARLERAMRENPRDAAARNAYITQRELIVGALLRDGDTLRLWGDLDAADTVYRRVLQLDPGASLAQGGLDSVARDRRHAARVKEADEALQRGDLNTAEKHARGVLAENSTHRGARAIMKAVGERRAPAEAEPVALKSSLSRSITLEFRDAQIRSVFEVIARESGVNFVFDRDVRPDTRVTIFVRNTNLNDVIRLVLATNQLASKLVNENSILVYPNTPAKQREYQETVVRSFYLANADVKQTAAMIRALVKTRDLFIDEKLNLVVMRDTPNAVRLAEQLVATQDLGEPEVMLEVEVLEVASSRLQEFGLRYTDRVNFGVLGDASNTQTIGQGGVIINTPIAGAPPPVIELRPRQYKLFIANPAMVLNLRQLDGTVNLLANPRIRVKNREKAKIHIGEKVPVITTTSTANVGVSSSVNYLEVGLKLDVEPNVFLEDEVAMKVQLEVSNILEQLNVSNTVSYRLGTRNTATTLRLRDGETQVLAGLINDEDRRAASRVPYLGELPMLGKLFSSNNDQRAKTEIVLLITPRVVRNLARPETVATVFHAGTEAAPGSPPLRIGPTAPRALSLAPTTPGFGAPQPPVPVPGTAPSAAPPLLNEAVALLLSAPAEIGLGQEFSVSLGLPATNQGANASVEVQYDPTVLTLIGGAAPPPRGADGQLVDPGRALIAVAAPPIVGSTPTPTEVRFRVVAKGPTTTQVRIGEATVVDANGRAVSVTMPGPQSINVVQPR
jgi:general secretion pathway protein D